jgi:acyl-CoA synthetase (AMP-forming)/AMP-acid ligase II/acyl carrier protein
MAEPRIVPLTHANVCAGVANVSATLLLGSEDRLLSILQLHQIGGVCYTLAALAAGGSVFLTPGFIADAFFDWAALADPTWFWAAPAMLSEMVKRAAGETSLLRAPRLRFIRVGSASLPAPLMGKAEQLFRVPVLENYGMTEAAVQIASSPLPPHVRKPGSVGVPVGIEIRMVNGEGKFVPPGVTGEIVIRGESVTAGYQDNQESAGGQSVPGWFMTGDLGHFDLEGYLFLTGRLKEIINRGGEKISPLEIDRVLEDHPDVERAVTFPVPHPTLGEEIASAVVLRPGSTTTEKELQSHAIGRLPVARVPRYIIRVDEIPSDGRGKVRRLALATQLGFAAGPPRGASATAPASPTEQRLTEMWKDVLGLPDGALGTDVPFLDLGGDSIAAARIISRVQQTFHVDLSPLAFFEAPTIAGLARIIEAKRAGVAAQANPIQEQQRVR